MFLLMRGDDGQKTYFLVKNHSKETFVQVPSGAGQIIFLISLTSTTTFHDDD